MELVSRAALRQLVKWRVSQASSFARVCVGVNKRIGYTPVAFTLGPSF